MVTMLDIYKNKRVFVTGNTGFKGSWLSALLEILGAEQMGFALDPDTNPSHYKLLGSPYHSVTGDIAIDVALLKKSIYDFQPDIVFHLAAQPLVRESYRDPVTTYRTNVMGTLQVLEAIRECKSVKAAVMITTDKVYENKESQHPYIETDQLGGYDIYSSSKAASEILIRSYQRSFLDIASLGQKHNTLIATARAGNVIGGGDWSNDRLIPDIVKAASQKKITKIRNPEAVRPWQHVLDCLAGYLLLGEKLLQRDISFAEAWNFAPYADESKTVREVTEMATVAWPDIRIEFERPVDAFHEAGLLKLDNHKAISRLNWIPKWDTQKSIEQTIRWYKAYYLDNKIITKEQIEAFLS